MITVDGRRSVNTGGPIVRRPRRSKPHYRVALLLALTLVLSHRLWLQMIGELLIVRDELERAEALVTMAGDRDRIDYAATLFHQGYAPWFVISDMWTGYSHPVNHYAAMARAQAIGRGVPDAAIVEAAGVPDSTYSELLNLRALVRERGWRSLLVVTSPTHTRRVSLMLGEVFAGSGVRLSVQPVAESWYDPAGWWLTPRGREETAREYMKLAVYLVGYR